MIDKLRGFEKKEFFFSIQGRVSETCIFNPRKDYSFTVIRSSNYIHD